jgi:hypothetical protein
MPIGRFWREADLGSGIGANGLMRHERPSKSHTTGADNLPAPVNREALSYADRARNDVILPGDSRHP